MSNDFLEALEADVGDDPVLVARAATWEQILEIEEFAQFTLPADYVHFLERYGAAIVGPYSVYGVGASEAMGNDERSIIEVTDRFRRDHWPGVENTLVISMDHAGNAITLDAHGAVRKFDHDAGMETILAPNFAEFVIRCLKDSG